jgi:hypothetical protein
MVQTAYPTTLYLRVIDGHIESLPVSFPILASILPLIALSIKLVVTPSNFILSLIFKFIILNIDERTLANWNQDCVASSDIT